MSRGDWQPDQYGRFEQQRARPFWDLAGGIAVDPPIERAVDLGCGTGALTAQLATRLDAGEMVGIDNSPNMLASAAERADGRTGFEPGDIATWTSVADHDLVFANASLHWVPDHAAVLARWIAALGPGGRIAVQVPANGDHASHLASVAVAETDPFLSAMGGSPPPDPVTANVLPPEEYATVLYELGVAEPEVQLRVYPHVFTSTEHVVEWTKGSSLTRFFKAMPEELHEPFLDAYRNELIARVGHHEPYLYTFKRILMWGRLDR